MQANLISPETNTDKLYQLISFLKRLAADVDWEAFRPLLSVLRKPQPNSGRPYFDVLLMFKIIVPQSKYNLSDEMPNSLFATAKRFRTFSASRSITPFPLGNEVLRSIGFARAKFWIGMRNLGSNIRRYLSLKKLGRVD